MKSSNLDSFVTSRNPPPSPLSTSSEIQDRGSTFIGTIYRISSPSAAHRIHSHHKRVVHHSKPATHEIAAWRCMDLKAGCDGLGGPDDFELVSGKDDDGEDHGGKTILKVMEREGVIDAIVIVSRWFGGTLLGPIRFTHIETCTREVSRAFKVVEEVEAVIEELKELDEQLSRLRTELAAARASTFTPTPSASASSNSKSESKSESKVDSGGSPVSTRREHPDYQTMLLHPAPDLVRAKRLVTKRHSERPGHPRTHQSWIISLSPPTRE